MYAQIHELLEYVSRERVVPIRHVAVRADRYQQEAVCLPKNTFQRRLFLGDLIPNIAYMVLQRAVAA